MTMLHTVNKAPSSSALADCLAICATTDALLLLENGVFAAVRGTEIADQLQRLHDAGLPIYAIDVDIQARGLNNCVIRCVQRIDYSQFVQLTLDYTATQSWF